MSPPASAQARRRQERGGQQRAERRTAEQARRARYAAVRAAARQHGVLPLAQRAAPRAPRAAQAQRGRAARQLRGRALRAREAAGRSAAPRCLTEPPCNLAPWPAARGCATRPHRDTKPHFDNCKPRRLHARTHAPPVRPQAPLLRARGPRTPTSTVAKRADSSGAPASATGASAQAQRSRSGGGAPPGAPAAAAAAASAGHTRPPAPCSATQSSASARVSAASPSAAPRAAALSHAAVQGRPPRASGLLPRARCASRAQAGLAQPYGAQADERGATMAKAVVLACRGAGVLLAHAGHAGARRPFKPSLQSTPGTVAGIRPAERRRCSGARRARARAAPRRCAGPSASRPRPARHLPYAMQSHAQPARAGNARPPRGIGVG